MKYRLFFAFLFVTVAAMAQHNHVPNNEGSKVKFQIKNFGITVTGYLSNLKGGITIDAGNVPQAIEVTCDVKTIDTDNEKETTICVKKNILAPINFHKSG
ncbi:MAG: YceI family protein [Chitinophagaceae bacterium]|nr:MAG: YceI family protein [Chitinophagaceae bacterium]